MTKKQYSAPESELSRMWEQALICDSLTGNSEDYDLVDGYTWSE